MKTIKIQIQCGETTCASEPGKFCQFIGSMKFGQIPVCMLFPNKESHTILDDSSGWVKRCDACLTASK